MADKCILTTYGEQQIATALASGSQMIINTVQLGSTNDFTLDPSMITVPNSVFTTTSTSVLSSVVLGADTMEFRVYLGTNIGPFQIGSIGIFDDQGGLILVAKLDNLVTKTITTEEDTGNTLQFKLPINISNVSQLVTSIGTQFFVDGVTIRLSSDNKLTAAIVPHHVFDIFQNASTKTPPGAYPMWTGEVIYCEGSREEFFNEAVSRQNNNEIRTLSESAWQSEVQSKGWTDAFVINSTDKSVRLPKYKGILYMSDPSTSESNKATGNTSGTYGFITVPTYIQVETTAVPATVAQCNAFTETLRNFATQFVTLATNQTITANKTWSGTNTFNGNVTAKVVNATGQVTSSGGLTVSGGMNVTSNASFTGTTYTANGTWTFNNTIQGTSYRALWADLAEYYKSDKVYPAGTLIKFGGIKEITVADIDANGVISTAPGLTLNTRKHMGKKELPVAMVGRVPVRVTGRVRKFDRLVLSEIEGVAKVYNPDTDQHKTVIAVALKSKLRGEEGLVLCSTRFKF